MTDTKAPLGRVHPGDPPALEFVRRLAHPMERVWRALTEREHLLSWMPCDIIGDRREPDGDHTELTLRPGCPGRTRGRRGPPPATTCASTTLRRSSTSVATGLGVLGHAPPGRYDAVAVPD